MKSKIKVFLLVFAMLGLLLNSCINKSEDLVTADAKTGGLVFSTSNIPYKLGATPTFNITLTVPKGPGITSIEVYNVYTSNVTGSASNSVLMTTVDVASANAAEEVIKTLPLTYADLKKDVVIDGAGLPSDETLLPIGDFWELTYISVLADGRKVINNNTTNVAVANRWAGPYLLSAYCLRAGDPVLTGNFHDLPWELLTNGSKSVVYSGIHPWGDGVSTIGGIGPWVLTIDDSGGSDNPMPVVVSDPANPAVVNNPAFDNRYEPSTQTFYLAVYWGNGPDHRAAYDTLVYNGE
jgi:hypothetical protein